MGGGGTRISLQILLGTLLLVSLVFSASAGAADHGFLTATAGWKAGGSIEDSISMDEFDMDSEISRRILATSSYISYRALKRGSTPCSVKGASYYNCRPGAQANPYRRGCSAIARCRS